MQTQTSSGANSATQPPAETYSWQGYQCAYDRQANGNQGTPLLLVHPIGVGLSRQFWRRFCQEWSHTGRPNPIYNPDLLGCGESEMPHIAYYPIDWANQLQHFLTTVVQTPVVLVVQGALLPVAIELVRLQPDQIRGLVLSGPPAWPIMNQSTPNWQQRFSWNLFDSPLGNGFYRYARRSQFLQSFSKRQLFATETAIDSEWLTTLHQGSRNPASRHAVFSFLAGFWRQDWASSIAQIQAPTLVVFGEEASSISREGKQDSADDRLQSYLSVLPQVEGCKIPGRNVMPYESTTEFVQVVAPFVDRLN